MTEIKLEVGKRYPTRNGGSTRITVEKPRKKGLSFRFIDENGRLYNDGGHAQNGLKSNDIIGHAIEEENMGSPLSHAENQKAWEEFKKQQPMWQGGYIKPTGNKISPVEPSSNPLQLQPGDVLTDKAGREWEVADLSEDPESIGWLYLKPKPKPKRLTGFVHVYENPYGDRKGYMLWDGEGELCPGTKELARIPLDQFEEGHGL